MFSISGEESRSLGFCVAPVGTPPHFLKRFQISALYAAVCSSFKSRWNSSTKYQVARPMERFTVTVFHTASWTMSIPGFFRFLPRPLISKQTRRFRISTVVR